MNINYTFNFVYLTFIVLTHTKNEKFQIYVERVCLLYYLDYNRLLDKLGPSLELCWLWAGGGERNNENFMPGDFIDLSPHSRHLLLHWKSVLRPNLQVVWICCPSHVTCVHLTKLDTSSPPTWWWSGPPPPSTTRRLGLWKQTTTSSEQALNRSTTMSSPSSSLLSSPLLSEHL